ncbi:MAG: hypothetical protein M3198_13865 [Actinomycetota bacterium]|nr:hypothetical protein [Actinomycetota bacterium]
MAQSPSQMQGQGGQVKDKVQDLAGQAGDQMQQVAGQAQEQVTSQVDARSTQLGEQIGSTADDLRSVAKELRNSDKEQPAKLADQVADKAEQVADYLKRSDGQTILSDVENFGRRQPWAVVAGGMAIGFLASRFLKSSSTNRYRSGSSLSSGGGRLEYDGPRDVDIPSSTYIPPVDEPALPATGAVSGSRPESGIGAGPGGTRISATPPPGGSSAPAPPAPGAVTGTTAAGTVDTPGNDRDDFGAPGNPPFGS